MEIYEADGPLHIGGTAWASTARRPSELVVNRLTDLRARDDHACTTRWSRPTVDRPGQLVVAIMGRMSAEDANSLLRVRRNRA